MSARQAALLGSLAALWGSSYLLIKYALRGFSPAEVVFGRAVLAAGVLLVVCRLQGGTAQAALSDVRRRPLHALALGAIAIAIPFLLISFGEKAVPSGLTAIFIAPASIFVAALAPLLDPSERLEPRHWVGLALGLGGVALLFGVESVSSFGVLLGSLAILAAAACYALGSYVLKWGYPGVPAVATSTFATGAAALLTVVPAAATAHHSAPGLGAVAALVALGVAHTALAFVIFYWLIGSLGAGRANLVSYVAPPFALGYGAALHGEHIGPAAVVGLVMILGGVWLASRGRR
ncbi:MAG: family transporter [Solirubrobacterales bacterium]|nr:family transporter [Solirubrobacterales bacterium]